MPRGPTRRMRKAGPTSPKLRQTSPRSAANRKELAQRLSSKRLAQPLQDSDDSDKLVVKGPGSRTGGYLPKNEIHASGGVGTGDKPGSHPTRAQRRKQLILASQSQQKTNSNDTSSPGTAQLAQTQSTETRAGIVRPTTTAPASAARPSTTQPTPSRDNSILDGIRPRRREHSILRAPEVEDSGLGHTDDSFALPDDESTPLHAAKAKGANNATPLTSQLPSSVSRKRKLGSPEPADVVRQAKPTVPSIPTPEPTLPPQPLSTLRASGQRQRPKIDDEDDSIMAPPMSSSSSNSPAKTKSSLSSKTQKSPQQSGVILTEQLQALMPLKRRKTARSRTAAHPEFDIPEESDSPAHHVSEADHDSSFLPTRRKARKLRPRETDRDQTDARSGTTKSKQKKSKAQPARTTSKAKANTSTRLTLSRSAGNQGTKSPSQHSTTADTRSPSSDPNANGDTVVASSSRAKRSGGSPLKLSMADIEAKENLVEVGENSDVLVARSDEEADHVEPVKPPSPKKPKSKWDEIDAWDMEFEEVEVWERSSEKDAR